MKKALLFLLVLMVFITDTALSANAIPINQLKKMAKAGNSKAEYKLAEYYSDNMSDNKGYWSKYVFWLKKSATGGYAAAEFEVGSDYVFGKNYPKAAYWLKKSAVQGNVYAEGLLGVLYYNGNGVPLNYKKAAYWIKKSATGGDSASYQPLSILYASGRGVRRNAKKAAYWHKKAFPFSNK